MRDPMSWSIPAGRFFGISVRVHLLYLVFSVAMIGRGVNYGYAAEAALVQLLLFISVLLHEFGHCFGARYVDGEAFDILMWPLGGLASVGVPNTPRANFIMTACGPLVNVLLCAGAAAYLVAFGLIPPMSPFWSCIGPESLYSFTAGELIRPDIMQGLLARLFYLNWILFWFNILLMGFPLDGGRLLQCVLWPYIGFRRSMLAVIATGCLIALALGIYVFITIEGPNASNSMMLFALGLFIFMTCRQQYQLLESGALTDDTTFGYDFSQGYTSLERDQPAPRRPKQGFLRRWLDRRAARKRQKEEELRVAEERRVDELLAKIRDQGTQSLTDEEKRFLNRVSAKLRHRNQS